MTATPEAMQAAREVYNAMYHMERHAETFDIPDLARALDSFAAAARADEREACAMTVLYAIPPLAGCFIYGPDAVKAIRQRGAK